MDPFRVCLALGPVAIYLVVLGLLNLSRRPLLVSGGRDAAALGLAAAGLVFVGPVELLFPDRFVPHVGAWSGLLPALREGAFSGLLLLASHLLPVAFYVAAYGLTLAMIVLMLRPRLIVYNISLDQLRPILAETVEQIDPGVRWAGDSLTLPGAGVHLYIDNHPAMRNVALVSAGSRQEHAGWRRLDAALAAALGRVESARNPARNEPLHHGRVHSRRLGVDHRPRPADHRPQPLRVAANVAGGTRDGKKEERS